MCELSARIMYVTSLHEFSVYQLHINSRKRSFEKFVQKLLVYNYTNPKILLIKIT